MRRFGSRVDPPFHRLSPGSIPQSITSFRNLTALSLGSNNLTGTIPGALYLLTQLNVLELVKNNLTGTVGEKIKVILFI